MGNDNTTPLLTTNINSFNEFKNLWKFVKILINNTVGEGCGQGEDMSLGMDQGDGARENMVPEEKVGSGRG